MTPLQKSVYFFT